MSVAYQRAETLRFWWKKPNRVILGVDRYFKSDKLPTKHCLILLQQVSFFILGYVIFKNVKTLM